MCVVHVCVCVFVCVKASCVLCVNLCCFDMGLVTTRTKTTWLVACAFFFFKNASLGYLHVSPVLVLATRLCNLFSRLSYREVVLPQTSVCV